MSNLFDDESDGDDYQAQPTATAETNPVSQEQQPAAQEQTYNYDQPADT